MNNQLTVLITGTNKGIGRDLVKTFLTLCPNSIIYATSRENPQAAYERWKDIDVKGRVICKILDISSNKSID